ncbi:hypothetical protein J437_LFUL004174 [Ladona fulva]|uniref:Reverse transcriptase n=1 Tax=Ladona fulva TaxID=123851 RepID=A0A8K0NXG4_LADFU|nr:hypothetical protein J437_LFUL004174 [Ladona fulva]
MWYNPHPWRRPAPPSYHGQGQQQQHPNLQWPPFAPLRPPPPPPAPLRIQWCAPPRQEDDVPKAWKISRTILLHKGGDMDDTSNWRPIPLQSTLAKIFGNHLKLKHRDISLWNAESLEDGDLSAPTTKASRWISGMMLCCSQSRSTHSEYFSLVAALAEFIASQLLSKGTVTSIMWKGPLVPSDTTTSGLALAYVDDFVIFGKSARALHQLLHAVSSAATWSSLQFKPRKCTSLHLTHTASKQGTKASQFHIQGRPMQMLKRLDGIQADVGAITASSFTPWQRLDAIRTFLLSRLDFHLRVTDFSKAALAETERNLLTATRAE